MINKPARALAVLTALVAVAATTGTAGAATTSLGNSAIFNDPLDSSGKYAIEDQFVSLIDGAPQGSTMRLNFYIFATTATRTRDAIISAHHRGVNVQIVGDARDTNNSTVRAITADLASPTFTGDTSRIVRCGANADGSYTEGTRTGCQGTGIHHSKFALFSATNGADKVVFETSANTNDGTTANSGIGA